MMDEAIVLETAVSVFLQYPQPLSAACIMKIHSAMKMRLIEFGYDSDNDHIGVCHNSESGDIHVHVCATEDEAFTLTKACSDHMRRNMMLSPYDA